MKKRIGIWQDTIFCSAVEDWNYTSFSEVKQINRLRIFLYL